MDDPRSISEDEEKFGALSRSVRERRRRPPGTEHQVVQPAGGNVSASVHASRDLVDRTRSEEERALQHSNRPHEREDQRLTPAAPVVCGASVRPLTNTVTRTVTTGGSRGGRKSATKRGPAADARGKVSPAVATGGPVSKRREPATPSEQTAPKRSRRGGPLVAEEKKVELPTSLNPVKETTVPEFRLRKQGSEAETIGLSNLTGSSQRSTLNAWFKKLSTQEPPQFKAWIWKGLHAGKKCLGCKVETRKDSKWEIPDHNYACRVCVSGCRPCIRLMTVEVDGEVKRELHVLPSQDQERPYAYWAAPPLVS